MSGAIGLLGGMFNPPHHGHLVCAQEARRQLGLEEVWLIPAGVPPHRPAGDDPGPSVRLELCRRAIAGQPGLAVSDVEVNRPGPSYTVDTLESLSERFAGDRPKLIVGADRALGMSEWRAPRRVGELATIVVAGRGGEPVAGAADAVAAATGAAPDVIDMPRIDVSSSRVRELAAQGLAVSHLVPVPVADLIAERGLYA